MIKGTKFRAWTRPWLVAGSVLATASLTGTLEAQTLEDADALRFGARESVLDISLSPSGKKLAYIAAGKDHAEILFVIDLAGDATRRVLLANTEKVADIDWCRWSDDVHLACQVAGMGQRPDGVLIPYDRLFSVDTVKGTTRELSRRQTSRALGVAQFGGDLLALDVADKPGQVLVTAQLIPEETIGTRLANTDSGLGVDLVDVASGRRTPRERADPDAMSFIADQNGVVRIKRLARRDVNGNLSGKYDYLYRPSPGSAFKTLGAPTIEGAAVASFYPMAVDAKRNVAYAFVGKGGYDAIAEFPLDGSGVGTILMSRSDVDVDGLIRIGRQRRVVGATYAT